MPTLLEQLCESTPSHHWQTKTINFFYKPPATGEAPYPSSPYLAAFCQELIEEHEDALLEVLKAVNESCE